MTNILSGMMPEDEYIRHYGVKGMKWGVRNEEFSSGVNSKGRVDPKLLKRYNSETSRIHRELRAQGHATEVDSALLKAKYETPDGPSTSRLSKNQKIAIGVGVGVVAAAGITYLAYKGGVFDKGDALNRTVKNFLAPDPVATPEQLKLGKLWDTRGTAYANAKDGLKLNWDNEVRLSAGSVLKRVSSTAETKVREQGFYACFRDEDVKSYSAILPSFWKRWGVGDASTGGFINHYQAASEVKAPSGKQTFEMFKKLVDESESFSSRVGIRSFDNIKDETFLTEIFKAFSADWIEPSYSHTEQFFKVVKDSGYNALIDFNDAGSLGKTPLRIIDSSIFKIVKSETLSFEDMVSAATEWAPSLIHYLMEGYNMDSLTGMMTEEEFLAHMDSLSDDELQHFGVKGMKWGKRKASSSGDGTPKAPSKTRLLALGAVGGLGSRDRYTDPGALAKRNQAGKTLTRGALLTAGSSVLGALNQSSNPNLRLGVAAVQGALALAGGVELGRGTIQGFGAINTEQRSRDNN